MSRIYLDDEFQKFWSKIESAENFTLMRSGNGEYAIMVGRRVRGREGWESPSGTISKLGRDLYVSHQLEDSSVYYGISCPDCDREAYYWYSSHVPNTNRTFANLWVNCNYPTFVQRFSTLQRDAVLITNYRAKGHTIGKLSVLQHYVVSDDCFSFWEQEAEHMLAQIKRDMGDKKNILYVVSAGPMSGAIIADLYKYNPHNCYIDFGSAIDGFYRKNITRSYMIAGNEYAERRCYMDNPQKTHFDVSVVMNLYKHPEGLEEQLQAVESQNLKPKEILLYQDGTSDTISIPEHLVSRFTVIDISPCNVGVWGRFYFAQRYATGSYICVLDDDTIPGRRWLENCHFAMQEQEGLYGTVGVVLDDARKYPYENSLYWRRIGWCNPNIHTVEVDFVGHSWFFKKEWLQWLLEAPKEIQLKIAGEDMAFSYQLQKHGIKTFVPPHPERELDLFGSIPHRAKKLGTQKDKISQHHESSRVFNKAVNILIDKGWKLMKERDRYQFNTVWNMESGKEYVRKVYLFKYIPLFYESSDGKRSFAIISVYKKRRRSTVYLCGFIPIIVIRWRNRKNIY